MKHFFYGTTTLCEAVKSAIIPVALFLFSFVTARGADVLSLAQTGDRGPSNGDTFQYFGLPTVNNAGRVAYSATLNTVSATGYGIYRSVLTAAGATQVVRAGNPAPGGGQFVSHVTSPPSITSSSEINFTYPLGPVTNGIFGISQGGAATRFLGPGSAAPNANGTLNSLPAEATFNDNGQAAFYDTLSGTSLGSANDEAIFLSGTSPGSLVEIVREGTSVPDGNGTFGESLAYGFTNVAFGNPSVNNSGTVAFGAGIKGSNTQIPGIYTSAFDSGIFIGNGSSIVQIARAGQTGISGGGTLQLFLSTPAINNNNQVAFVAQYYRNLIVNDAIYRNDSGTLIEIAHAGEALPGGGTIYSLSQSVVINDAGQVASLIGTPAANYNVGSGGIIRGSGGDITVVAQVGQSTPRGDGTIFVSFLSSSFAMNRLGDVAFTAVPGINPNVVPANSKGLYLYSDRFGLVEIAYLGEPLNGSTITGLALAGADAFTGVSPFKTGLNDNGQVVFRFDLADGREGIAVWPAPKPGLITLPTVAVPWHIAGAGDFNGDGSTDLVWENTSTGQRAIWLLKNGVFSSSYLLPTIPVQWHIAGVGDFNGDGSQDLVWENTSTGQRVIWLLNNGVFSSSYLLPTIPVQWHIVGVGDFNGDGSQDVVWENTATGQRAIWLLKNGVFSSSYLLPTVPVQWHIAGVGDFDGDGNVDLVWENTATGQRAIWLLKNGVFSSSYPLPTVPVQWHIAAVGDFNGDGSQDLVWENTTTGQRVIWLLKNGVF